jgi:hypothetical protein
MVHMKFNAARIFEVDVIGESVKEEVRVGACVTEGGTGVSPNGEDGGTSTVKGSGFAGVSCDVC